MNTAQEPITACARPDPGSKPVLRTGNVRDDRARRRTSCGVVGTADAAGSFTLARCHPGHPIRTEDESRRRDLDERALIG